MRFFDTRWRMSARRLSRRYDAGDPQVRVGMSGERERCYAKDTARGPIRGGIAAYAAARGVTVAQLEQHTGLTRRTFNRLAGSSNTHRVRDLVAGVAVLIAADRESH